MFRKNQPYGLGNMTDSTGTTRTFETSALPTGSAGNYEIRVVIKHDGKEHTVSKVIDLAAGDDIELSFETTDTLADSSLIEKVHDSITIQSKTYIKKECSTIPPA